jgi:hypothetical protein
MRRTEDAESLKELEKRFECPPRVIEGPWGCSGGRAGRLSSILRGYQRALTKHYVIMYANSIMLIRAGRRSRPSLGSAKLTTFGRDVRPPARERPFTFHDLFSYTSNLTHAINSLSRPLMKFKMLRLRRSALSCCAL